MKKISLLLFVLCISICLCSCEDSSDKIIESINSIGEKVKNIAEETQTQYKEIKLNSKSDYSKYINFYYTSDIFRDYTGGYEHRYNLYVYSLNDNYEFVDCIVTFKNISEAGISKKFPLTNKGYGAFTYDWYCTGTDKGSAVIKKFEVDYIEGTVRIPVEFD